VVEELRKDDDKGVPQRQDMVDLKEREAAQAEQQALGIRDAARDQEQQINQERRQVDQERQQISQERQQNQEDAAAGKTTPGEAQAKENELARREQAADQKTTELDQRQSAVDQQKEDARKLEDFADKKTEEARQDRESIAQDQQAAIDASAAGSLIGITIKTSDSVMGTLVRIDSASGKELKRSPLDTVYVRTVTLLGGKIFAIAGENKGNGAIRLIEVNTNNLEMANQGDDDMHPGSLIWANGNDLYAVTLNRADGSLNMGRFNADLTLQAKSKINVHPNASLSIQQGILLTQKTNGSAALLNPINLTEIFGQ
jgi:hypothetical protein